MAVVCELDRTSQFVGKLMIKRIDAAACRLLHEPSFEGGNPLIGRWVNFDREAPDITGVTVRADGDRLAIAIDQADRDGARHWSALSGAAMAERTGGGPAIGFLAMGDLFGERGEGRREEAALAGIRVRHLVEHLAEQSVHHCIRACGARSLIRPSPVERILRDLTFYLRHDNDDHVLATIGRQVLGERHDVSFYKP